MLTLILLLVGACHAWPSYGGLRDTGNCNPLVKDSHCPPDPAFAGRRTFHFQDASASDLAKFWAVDANDTSHLRLNSDSSGLEVRVDAAGQKPTLTSHKYLLFGKVSVRVRAAAGAGLVTTVVLKSDSGDEIDWELLGAFDRSAQSNYYHSAEPLFNTYNTTYALPSSSPSTTSSLHTYTVVWTDTSLTFSIDGVDLHTSTAGVDIPSEKWPQTPMQIHLGLWSVKSDDDPGEIAWAGGVADFSGKDYVAAFESVEVEDYTGWCEEVEGGNVAYEFGDGMGWADVTVDGCRKRREPGKVGPAPTGTSASGATSGATSTGGGAEPTSGSDDDGDDGNGDDSNDDGDDEENAAAGLDAQTGLVVSLAAVAWTLFA